MSAVPFESFAEAYKAMPSFIADDPLGHTTISDLHFLVQHEIDLFTEGENNEISSDRRGVTKRRLNACKNFLARCKASMEGA